MELDWSRAQVDRPSCNGCGQAVEWADLRWRVAVGIDPTAGGDGSVAVGAVPDGEPWHRACRRRAEWVALVAAVRDVGGSAVVVVDALAPIVGTVASSVAALAASNRRAIEHRAGILGRTVREDVGRWWRRAPVERVIRPAFERGALAVVAAGRWRRRRRPGGWDVGRVEGVGVEGVRVEGVEGVAARVGPGRVGDARRGVLDGHVPVGSAVAPDEYYRWGFRYAPGRGEPGGDGEFRPVYLRWPGDRAHWPAADEAAAVDGSGRNASGYVGWTDESWAARRGRGQDDPGVRRDVPGAGRGPRGGWGDPVEPGDVDTTDEQGRGQRPDNGR